MSAPEIILTIEECERLQGQLWHERRHGEGYLSTSEENLARALATIRALREALDYIAKAPRESPVPRETLQECIEKARAALSQVPAPPEGEK